MIEETLSSETLYEGRIITVRKEVVRLPNGQTGHRELVDHAPAVVILPIDSNGMVHLIKQYRKPFDQVIIEAPAGIMDPGESPLTAAKRELAEETGFRAQKWTSLGSAMPSPGFCDELYHLYLAEDLEPGQQQFDADEFLSAYPIPFSAFKEACLSQTITDAKTLLCYFYYQSLKQ